MKRFLSPIIVALLLAYAAELSAVTYDVIGPCSNKAVYSGTFKTDITESVGKISMDIFDANNIPYVGTENGMNTIINTPVGDEALEILSDTKMRAYGWCFSINGVIPDVLSSQAYVTKQNDYISWFYAYSTYDRGVWTDYCVPSYKIKSPQFCK